MGSYSDIFNTVYNIGCTYLKCLLQFLHANLVMCMCISFYMKNNPSQTLNRS